MTIDLLPTIASLIDAPLGDLPIDGRDIRALLEGEPEARSPHEALFFYYDHNALEALRSGKWKLVFPHVYRSLTGTPGRDGTPAGDTHLRCGLELYDLEADIGEQHDVAADFPRVVARLTALADAMRADLGDSLSGREGRGRREPGEWLGEWPAGQAR